MSSKYTKLLSQTYFFTAARKHITNNDYIYPLVKTPQKRHLLMDHPISPILWVYKPLNA